MINSESPFMAAWVCVIPGIPTVVKFTIGKFMALKEPSSRHSNNVIRKSIKDTSCTIKLWPFLSTTYEPFCNSCSSRDVFWYTNQTTDTYSFSGIQNNDAFTKPLASVTTTVPLLEPAVYTWTAGTARDI